MKKIILALICVVIILTVGCSKSEITVESTKPQVYCSFYGIYDFVSEIGGDRIDVYNMVPTGTEPHDWEPSTKDMADLIKADVIFYNGLGMEGWIDKVKSSVGEDVKFVELSEGIADENTNDPHIWLDPNNAEKMCISILDELCELDSVNSNVYEQNSSNLISEIQKVDNEYKTALTGISNNKIVVAHEAYSYLCKAYGLEQIAIEGISADSEPSPSKMKELINTLIHKNIKYVFFEELVSSKVAETLAAETGAELLELNPIEGLTDEEIANGDNYVSVMRKNLANIKIALGVN